MADQQQASMADVKRVIRKKLRKHEEHGEEGLNIYPMMDMMVILLVFLIANFSASSADIVQSAELQIPTSTAQVRAAEALTVIVSSSEVVVEGKPVLALRNGKVDPSQKQGGANGWLISELFENVKQHRERLKLIASQNPQRPFKGQVRIIADKRTPFRTLGEVIYTLGQSEFGSLRFIVLKSKQEA